MSIILNKKTINLKNLLFLSILFLSILFLSILSVPFIKDSIKDFEIVKFDFHPQKLINHEELKKINKFHQYLSGISDFEIEEQMLKNFNITFHDKRFIYDVQKKEIIFKNIDTLLNQKIYFARSCIEIKPGILSFRDKITISIRYYFELEYLENNYCIKICPEIS